MLSPLLQTSGFKLELDFAEKVIDFSIQLILVVYPKKEIYSHCIIYFTFRQLFFFLSSIYIGRQYWIRENF